MERSAVKKQDSIPENSADPGGSTGDSEAISPERARAEKHSVKVRLGGKEYRLRSDATEESLQRVADYVDHAMLKIRERTDTVDSQDVALLASLNLAREVLYLREQVAVGGGGSASRLRRLIARIESELPPSDL